MTLWKTAGAVAGLWAGLAACAAADEFRIASWNRSGELAWAEAATCGVCTVESAPSAAGPWAPLANFFSTDAVGRAAASLPAAPGFVRLLSSDVSADNPDGFANFTQAYGVLETVAGNGQGYLDNTCYWVPEYEGALATEVALSRPHIAAADRAGNIYIADKCSHSVLKITPDGRIHTAAGTHVGGFNGDGPDAATSLQLSKPNGLWVRADGTVYILDYGNARVRRLDPDGTLRTLFADPYGIPQGRGLWVADDESHAYFAAGTALMSWTRDGDGGTIAVVNGEFVELGNIAVEAAGTILATDRGAGQVYRVDPADGTRTVVAGNGTWDAVVDGTPGLDNGLHGVRGVWPVPTGGLLLATHEGSQVLYLDAAGILHLLLDGMSGHNRAGDGAWFYDNPPFAYPYGKISEARSVALDPAGNILVVENDWGYVRRIRFLRMNP